MPEKKKPSRQAMISGLKYLKSLSGKRVYYNPKSEDSIGWANEKVEQLDKAEKIKRSKEKHAMGFWDRSIPLKRKSSRRRIL